MSSVAYNELLTILGAVRNGFVYGVRVRAPHSMVIHAVWSNAPWHVAAQKIVALTVQHATNLAVAAGLFKLGMFLLRQIASGGRNVPWHTALMGGVGGFLVWGRELSPVSVQVNLYMFSRVIGGLATLFIESREKQAAAVAAAQKASSSPELQSPAQLAGAFPSAKNASSNLSAVEQFLYGPRGYRVFSFFLWALAIHIFYEYPHALQPAMSGSLKYMYHDSRQHGGSLQKAILGF